MRYALNAFHLSIPPSRRLSQFNLRQALQKEVTRQMADGAEIQRLKIVNLRLLVENAKMEELLK
jgi:hypothetical protein